MIQTHTGIIEHIEEKVIIPDSQDAPSKRNPILIQKLTVSGSQGNIVLINTDFVFTVGQNISVEYDNLTIMKDNTPQPNYDSQEAPIPISTVLLISLFPYTLLLISYLSFRITNIEIGNIPSFVNDLIGSISVINVAMSYPLYALFNLVIGRIGYYCRNTKRSITT